MTYIVKPEIFGVTVPRETFGIKINAEQHGITLDAETMGVNATKLIPGIIPDGDGFWLWGDGETILWGDDEEMEL